MKALLLSNGLIILIYISLSMIVKHGVSPEDASFFVGRSYLSMVQDAERDCHDPKRIDALVEEQTPGGLNEQVSLSNRLNFSHF